MTEHTVGTRQQWQAAREKPSGRGESTGAVRHDEYEDAGSGATG